MKRLETMLISLALAATAAGGADFNVRTFGAVGDGSTKDTTAVQRALDACAQAGGGRVTVPPGTYLIGSVYLGDRTELHLQEGATLLGSPNLADYNDPDAYPQNWGSKNEGWSAKHLILALEKQGVSITGRGVIDGNGRAFFDDKPQFVGKVCWRDGGVNARDRAHQGRPGQEIVFIECRDVAVRDVTFRDMSCWSCFFHGCENVAVGGVTVRNDLTHLNTDGFDVDSCRNVTIGDCDIVTGDDALAIRGAPARLKDPAKVCENVRVSNIVCRVSADGMRVGVGNGTIRNLRVSDMKIEHAGRGLHLQCVYGKPGPKGVDISDISFERVSIRDAAEAIHVGVGSDISAATLANIRFSHVSAEALAPSVVCGGRVTRVKGVTFTDCSFNVARPALKAAPHDSEDKALRSDGLGVFRVQSADDVSFANCTFRLNGAPVTDPRQTFSLHDAVLGGDSLLDSFVNPPASARPHVWWHWMNGNVTKAGITADLEAMAKAGIGGAQIFDVSDGIPAGHVEFCSPAWFDMLHFANEEAKRLGIELALSNCSGWSSSGGPWVKPEDSMKHVVFTERTVRGGEHFSGTLDAPANTFGFYRDLAVLAFPRPAAEAIDPADYGMKVTYSRDKCKSAIFFKRPFPLSGVSIDFDVTPRHIDALVKVEVCTDGKTFHTVVDNMTVYTARYGDKDTAVFIPVDCGSVHAVKVTCDLTAVTAMPGPVDQGVKTIRPPNAKGLASKHQRVVAVRPEARARIPEFSSKAFALRAKIHGYPYAADANQVVDPARIINLTGRAALPRGLIDWTAPVGTDWVVVRFGYASNGVGPRPATPAGSGLEVDKLSKPALARFFAGYVDKVLARLGPVSPKGGLNNVLVDSFEVGCQNWTDGFEKIFKERRGYDIVPWLPILTGRVVASPAETDRVLADFRRVISDLFVENYAGEFQRLCHARGLLFSLEGYGNAPCDDLRYARRSDVPMGEFWAGNAASPTPAGRLGGMGNARFPGFIAHVWGQRFVGAESFTSAEGERWNRDPFGYKAQGDRAFCQGINRIIYHRWAMQPWTNPANFPGMTMGPHGSHFERTLTWWEDGAPAWLLYQTRCQWMLQEGTVAADVLVFGGDSPTGYGLDLSRWHDHALVGENAFGLGRQWDVCGGEAILASRAENGQVVTPSGARYKAIAVLPNIVVDAASQAALDRLAAQGVPVVPSAEVDAALAAQGIGPDFLCLTPACTNDIRWIHRRAPDGSEIYFVALPNEEPASLDVSFRISGRKPEIWNPENGQVCAASYQEKDGRTIVHLDFDPSGAAFVVFRKSPTGGSRSCATATDAQQRVPPVLVTGPWEVTFLNGRGAPAAPVTFDALTPWNEHPEDGIRYYSGSAIYRKTISDPRTSPTEHLILDLGGVKNIATVTVNGKTFPVLWKPPYRVDITEAPGGSRSCATAAAPLNLEIKITNLWPNRLIGDDALPCDAEYHARKGQKNKGGIIAIPRRVWEGKPSPSGRHTFTTWRLWKKSDKLLPSGLIGPVRLLH